MIILIKTYNQILLLVVVFLIIINVWNGRAAQDFCGNWCISFFRIHRWVQKNRINLKQKCFVIFITHVLRSVCLKCEAECVLCVVCRRAAGITSCMWPLKRTSRASLVCCWRRWRTWSSCDSCIPTITSSCCSSASHTSWICTWTRRTELWVAASYTHSLLSDWELLFLLAHIILMITIIQLTTTFIIIINISCSNSSSDDN